MKAGFYPKLAFDGIRKNKRMYLPYILTCVGMVMMYYIIIFLRYNDRLSALPGSAFLQEMMGLGAWIIAVFACVFLFYTNSFLLRRRKKEFGLYHILGMGKRNIGWILFWESLIIAVFALSAGLLAGIAFSKLAELGLVNIMNGKVSDALTLFPEAIRMTAVVFGIIFLLLFLNSLRQIKFSNTVSLLKSENSGERPPKGNWFLGLLGILTLGTAYYIAAAIQDPVAAILLFFVAVILVILGTYLILISGSVLFCRLLQKCKKYYYRPNHFVSVSSMSYRMKRNGAGLASICILATMVLVMISSTTSLYFGAEDSLNARYPKEMNLNFQFHDTAQMSEDSIEKIRNGIQEIAGVPDSKEIHDFRCASVSGLLEGDTVLLDPSALEQFQLDTYSNVYQFHIIPISDYNKMMGTEETLQSGEAILSFYRRGYDYQYDTISFRDGQTFHVKKVTDQFIGSGEAAMSIVPTMAIFVSDLDAAIAGIDTLADFSGNRMVILKWKYCFDTGTELEEQTASYKALKTSFSSAEAYQEYGYSSFSCENRELNRIDYYGLYGGLFYLGIVLSIVFIFAAVLIIYYKQISEGYEDQSRFGIMQKVGMTKKEIRKSINSQLLTVFFLPLIFAGLHLAFAFPVIRKLLLLFQLNNVALFAFTTAVSFLVFALFYTLIYRITSNAYYKIVSDAKDA